MGLLLFLTIFWSFTLLGALRTAIWLLPALFLGEWLPIVCAALLTMFSAVTFLAPYQNGFFDLRDWQKDRFAILLFMCGLGSSVVGGPSYFQSMVIGSVFILFFWQLCKVFRFPLSLTWNASIHLRWLLPLSWLVGILKAMPS